MNSPVKKKSWINEYDSSIGFDSPDPTEDQILQLKADAVFGKINLSELGDINISYCSEIFVEQIYREVFGKDIAVRRSRRYGKQEWALMDRQFHIDCAIELPNGSRLLGQEKVLRARYANFETFTIEYYQDREKKEPGEFFHIAAQFYFHGYWNQEYTGIDMFCLIDLLKFLDWLKSEYSVEDMNAMINSKRRNSRVGFNAPQNGKASFFYIPYNLIPRACIHAYKEKGGDIVLPREYSPNTQLQACVGWDDPLLLDDPPF